MDKAKVTRNQQQTSSQASAANGDKTARGYPAVTRFAQAPAPSAHDGNGLPHQLRQGVETLSGMSMADTTVHYNSTAPAQIGALAYAAGNQIHLGPGQEQHLPHEAWHVVQQKQGRVKPTLQAKGLALNDDQALETEADAMGQRAAQLKTTGVLPTSSFLPVFPSTTLIQRKIGFEFQAVDSIFFKGVDVRKEELGKHIHGKFTVEGDGGTRHGMPELELATPAVEETKQGRKDLEGIMDAIRAFLLRVKDDGFIAAVPAVEWNDDIVKKAILNKARQGFLDEPKIDQAKEDSPEEKIIKETLLKERAELFNNEVKDVPKFSIPSGAKHFHPQATVGVKFDKIADLIDYLSSAPIKTRDVVQAPPPETKQTVTGTDGGPKNEVKEVTTPIVAEEIKRDPRKTAAANIIGWGGARYQLPYQKVWKDALNEVNSFSGIKSPKVKGLAMIFLGMAKSRSTEFRKTVRKAKLLKYMMPFMLRNGFWPFFGSLTPEELEELKGFKNAYKNVLNVKVMPPKSKEEWETKIPTVKEIIEHMVARTEADDEEYEPDLLQKGDVVGHGNITNMNHDGYWKMDSIDDIGQSSDEPAGEKRRGAIIELRKLGNEVPHNKLTEFALAVFDLITLINAPDIPATDTATATETGGTPASAPSGVLTA
ncbi:DUF4157 domain-containing protein [Mucilaginibacter angelicae]|uniref:DUF4157 domain-containing protein n=1 Tax=Mucilaginibacter angelicae TaxID=869718 RepID=A0ABV6LF18_9SPHI